MKIIILAHTASDKINWGTYSTKKHIERFFAEIKHLGDENEVIVCTDSEAVKDASSSLFRCEPIEFLEDDGFEDKVKTINGRLEMVQDEDVCIIDLHSLYLTRNDFQDVISFYKKETSPVISVSDAENHPYFLYLYQDIICSETLHIFDDNYENESLSGLLKESYKISRPYRFEWENYTDSEKKELYVLEETRRGITFKEFSGDKLTENRTLLLYEDSSTARTIVSVNEADELIGVSDNLYNGSCRTSMAEEHGSLYLYLSDSYDKHEVELVPFDNLRIYPEFVQKLFVSGGKAKIRKRKIPENLSGFLVTILKTVENGIPGIQERFNPGGILWDGHTNLVSGEQITGRQRLPEVLEYTGGITIGKISELENLSGLISNEKVRGFKISERYKPIYSEIELIRYEVKSGYISEEVMGG